MPRSTTTWEIGNEGPPRKLAEGSINLEKDLESWIEANPELLEPSLRLLARQLDTGGSGQLDLLCLDSEGRLVIVELKRAEAYRETLAQVLDYAARVRAMPYEELEGRIDANRQSHGYKGTLDEILEEVLKSEAENWTPSAPEPRMLIAGTGADQSLKGIVEYLEQYSVPVNGVFFDVYATGDNKRLLVRTGIVSDEQAAVQGRGRGRRAKTHAEVLAFAESKGTRGLVEPVGAAWQEATGKAPRPESSNTWTLQSRRDARTTASKLWPWSTQEPQLAWLEVSAEVVAGDVGVTTEQLRVSLEEAGIELRKHADQDAYWVDLSDAARVDKVVKWIKATYAK